MSAEGHSAVADSPCSVDCVALQVACHPQAMDMSSRPDPSPRDNRPPNLYDLAIDRADNGLSANIYVACSRVGVEVVNFDADTGFSTETQRLVTSGEAHSCTIRDRAGQKVLLVGDLSGGYRFYREGQ